MKKRSRLEIPLPSRFEEKRQKPFLGQLWVRPLSSTHRGNNLLRLGRRRSLRLHGTLRERTSTNQPGVSSIDEVFVMRGSARIGEIRIRSVAKKQGTHRRRASTRWQAGRRAPL